MPKISTTREAVDALGGLSEVAKLTEAEYATAWHWLKNNKFPAKTYLVLNEALAAQGYSAPSRLWGMVGMR